MGLHLDLRHYKEPKKRGRPPIEGRANRVPHGKVDGYQNHGCRCPDCRRAWNEYQRERRKKKAAARAVEAERTNEAAEIMKAFEARKAKDAEIEQRLKEIARDAERALSEDPPND